MASPAERIEVVCAGCGAEYETWHRRSINLILAEELTDDEVRDATSERCPECGLKVELATLIVEAKER
ncbi:MAG TPA: hypothetical protein VNI55_08935 [Gaiellaceae bacterium]|nr:hypothetical protein [Gaiellaceae bacterium]